MRARRVWCGASIGFEVGKNGAEYEGSGVDSQKNALKGSGDNGLRLWLSASCGSELLSLRLGSGRAVAPHRSCFGRHGAGITKLVDEAFERKERPSEIPEVSLQIVRGKFQESLFTGSEGGYMTLLVIFKFMRSSTPLMRIYEYDDLAIKCSALFVFPYQRKYLSSL